jgi:hypothetical protein
MTAPLTFVVATALGVSLGAAATIAAGAEPADAEYAIRWNARDGGPASLNETLSILKTRATRPRQFKVDYYDLPPTPTTPPGFSVILRRRVDNGGPAELTWKLRGDHALADWACPLRNSKEAKDEVDVTFRSMDNVTRSFAYSCTSDAPDLAASELSATIRACTSEVVRQDAGKLTIEEWRLPGNVTVIDVSLSGKNVPGAMELFRKRIAEPLLAAGIVPSADSKSELGGSCQ